MTKPSVRFPNYEIKSVWADGTPRGTTRVYAESISEAITKHAALESERAAETIADPDDRVRATWFEVKSVTEIDDEVTR